jgi:glycosyltransferase involved in cell wall biosynthesis
MLVNAIENYEIEIVNDQNLADIEFCLIQRQHKKIKPSILRIDGIYFNTTQDYNKQNQPLKHAYETSDTVICQSSFNKALTERWFGKHNNAKVIHNAADMKIIEKVNSSGWDTVIDPGLEVWSCASNWRPHKRLRENIRYFTEKSEDNSILVIAGAGLRKDDLKDFVDLLGKKIFYVGELDYLTLLSLYKRSTTFLLLAYLDHCPNVVVDAQASGCRVVCSSTGGTKEIVNRGTVVVEDNWDFSPINLYDPPKINFDSYLEISVEKDQYDINNCSKLYYDAFKELVK